MNATAQWHDMEIGHYLRAVAKRAWLVLLMMVLLGGAAHLATRSVQPTFLSSSTLLVTGSVVNPPTSSANPTSTGGQGNQRSSAIAGDIINLSASQPVVNPTADSLGINPEEIVNRVRVAQVKGSNLIKITAAWPDAEMAPQIANTLAANLIAYFRDVNRRDARELRLYIEQELARTRTQLLASDRLIQVFKERHRIVDLSQAATLVSQEISSLRQERDATRIKLEEADAKLAAARSRLSKEDITRVSYRTTKDNPVFQQIQTALTELEIQRAELAQVFTPQHPKMREVAGQIARLKEQLSATARTVLSEETTGLNPLHDQLLTQLVTLEAERVAARAKLDALNLVERARLAALARLPSVETGLNMLARENELLESEFTLLSQRYRDALLREKEAGYIPAGVQIMDIATTGVPEGRGPRIVTVMGFLAGLLLGMFLAIFLEVADDPIRTANDAERTLGVPVLAKVPNMAAPRTAPAVVIPLIVLILALVVAMSTGALGFSQTTWGERIAVSTSSRLEDAVNRLARQIHPATR